MIYDTAPDIMKILEQCIAISQYCHSYVKLDKFSCAIYARAIFSAVSCLKSLLITVWHHVTSQNVIGRYFFLDFSIALADMKSQKKL